MGTLSLRGVITVLDIPGLFPEPTFLMPLNVGKNVAKSREVIVEGIH